MIEILKLSFLNGLRGDLPGGTFGEDVACGDPTGCTVNESDWNTDMLSLTIGDTGEIGVTSWSEAKRLFILLIESAIVESGLLSEETSEVFRMMLE